VGLDQSRQKLQSDGMSVGESVRFAGEYFQNAGYLSAVENRDRQNRADTRAF
jgi:hypothetical protein